MELRGERECGDCGTRWSYYETGSVDCPSCGSLHSTSVGEAREHTDSDVGFDLSPVRNELEQRSLQELADEAAGVAADYLRAAGFVHAGELQPFAETYLAAAELRRVGSTAGRVMRLEDTERLYLLELLRGADTGERPEPDAVPETFHPERGLAVAAAVDQYLDEFRRVREAGTDPALDRVVSTLENHRRRIDALDGAVDPGRAETLVRATRDASRYWREDDEGALARASERLED